MTHEEIRELLARIETLRKERNELLRRAEDLAAEIETLKTMLMMQVPPVEPDVSVPIQQDQPGEEETAEGVFRVLEARESKPGVIRAFVEAEDGTKTAMYAKNGAGRELASSLGKTVTVTYKKLDKGLFALKVKSGGELN
ncbi:hypothetical protein [Syntrophothermus lipocalidus]|uniref:Uncharacterized protein n=1 Tax=Syntrophothermus lipocalidus (strain DSM 12680 / TGB-C1) TaxID=643648 RepID=D7CPY4_SYNLT|nr:hypothetical protein [Syntrophothermus lipocalidus]ADI02762.1 conserved hypothetical protein [Syntrophothermus lipocalidus DSM 12680]